MRRRIASRVAAVALVSRCRERLMTEGVVGGSTCEELMEDLGVSEEDASALRLDDAAWHALLARGAGRGQ